MRMMIAKVMILMMIVMILMMTTMSQDRAAPAKILLNSGADPNALVSVGTEFKLL